MGQRYANAWKFERRWSFRNLPLALASGMKFSLLRNSKLPLQLKGEFSSITQVTLLEIMSEFKFACPHCQQHFRCGEECAGREIQCPSCKVLIHIPHVPSKTAQYQRESGKTWATFVPAGEVKRPKGLSVNREPKLPAPES